MDLIGAPSAVVCLTLLERVANPGKSVVRVASTAASRSPSGLEVVKKTT